MKRELLAIVVLALIVIGIVLQFTQKTEVTKQTIKIGVVLPLTGGAGFLGEGIQKAILLAQENLKDTKYNYEVIFEDDKLDPKATSTATQKLINIDGVDAILSITSGSGNVVSPLAEENKVIHIGSASDPNVAKGKYNFIHWTPPPEENRVFVEELQRRGIKKIALLELNQQGVKAIVDDLKEKIIATDIKVVSEEIFNFGDKDFKTIILKAKQSNPDIYYLHAFSPELEILAKQIKELGITAPMTSIEAFEFTEQPELFEGMWYVQAADPTKEFNIAFEAKYGKAPTVGAPNAYDAFNILVFVYEKAGKTSDKKPLVDEVVAVLEKIKDYKGALGNLNMLEEGIVLSKAVVREVRNGTFVTVS